MLRKFIIVLSAVLASGWAAHAAPLELYGRLPSIEQAAVSPSGKLVAYIVTDGEKRTIAVESVPERKPIFVGQAGHTKVRDLAWATDEHLLITSSTTDISVEFAGAAKDERYVPFDLNLRTGNLLPLLGDAHGVRYVMNINYGPLDIRTIDGKPIVFARGFRFLNGTPESALFRVDLSGDFATLEESGGTHLRYDWIVSSGGAPTARTSYDDKSATWKLMLKTAGGGWRTVEQLNAPIETPDIDGVGRDGKSVLISTVDDKVGTRWREVSVESGVSTELDEASGHPNAIHDPATGRLIGVFATIGDSYDYTFFDPHDAAIWRAVTKAFPGDLVSLESWSDDRKKIVVRVDSADMGPAYALVDLNTGDADWLGNEYAGLRAEDISPTKAVSYKAADGLEITGYLTVPLGHGAHAMPLVVLAHGGPASRDYPGFDWWAQALASRGYAVLRANFRGSGGLGYDFRAAGYGEWGRKMQTDLSDGVRDLVRRGVVDPKRVCIAGASYGGYAALAGATIDHGVYRCAVSVAGVSDLHELATEPGYDGERYWLRFMGAKDAADAVLATYSPADRAGEADIPILLIHGKDDTVVPIRQSQKMLAALQRAGKPVEYIEMPGEDHRLSRGETRLQMLKATVAFLEKNNPPN